MKPALMTSVTNFIQHAYDQLDALNAFNQAAHDGEPFENWPDHVNNFKMVVPVIIATNYQDRLINIIADRDMFFDEATSVNNPYLADAYQSLNSTEKMVLTKLQSKLDRPFFTETQPL